MTTTTQQMDQPKHVGPPHKYNPHRVKVLVEAIRKGLPRTQACALAGISYSTLKKWYQTHPDLLEQLDTAEAECMERAMDVIQHAAQEDPKWASWLLSTRFAEQFARASRGNVNIGVQGTGATVHVSLEECNELAKDLSNWMEDFSDEEGTNE